MFHENKTPATAANPVSNTSTTLTPSAAKWNSMPSDATQGAFSSVTRSAGIPVPTTAAIVEANPAADSPKASPRAAAGRPRPTA